MSNPYPEEQEHAANTQIKALVQSSYDTMGTQFHAWATQTSAAQRIAYADAVLALLAPRSTVLELGCGGGEPVLTRLLRHENVDTVFANDISAHMLGLARETCPTARFVAGDMIALSFEAGSLDAVVGFFSVFHLPREEQRVMFERVFAWLKGDGGVVAVNLNVADEEGSVGRFFGQGMFWSGWGVEGSLEMVRAVGFEVLRWEVKEVDVEDKTDPDYGKRFLWVLMRKGKTREGIEGS